MLAELLVWPVSTSAIPDPFLLGVFDEFVHIWVVFSSTSVQLDVLFRDSTISSYGLVGNIPYF